MEKFIRRLFPKESPLELLVKLSEIGERAVSQLRLAVEDYFNGRDISSHGKVVDGLERDADKLKFEIRNIYKRIKWGYFDKSELDALVSSIEMIVDVADDILKLLQMNQVSFCPKDVSEGILNIAVEVERAVRELRMSAEELWKVVESGFSPSEYEKEEEMVSEVECEESSVDALGIKVGKKIFSLKEDLNPVDVMFLGRITTMLSQISDLAENAAERIRDMAS